MLLDLVNGRRPFTALLESGLCFWDAPTSEMEGMGGSPADAPPPPEPRVTGADDGVAQPAAPPDDAPPARDLSTEPATVPDDDDPISPLLGEADTELAPDPQGKHVGLTPERFNAVVKSKARLEAAYRKALPTIQALRAAGVDLNDLLNAKGRLEAIERSAAANPWLADIMAGKVPAGMVQPPAAPAKTEYPFDVNDEQGRWMANFHAETTKLVDALKTQNGQLQSRLDTLEGTTRSRDIAAWQRTWKDSFEAAAKEIPDDQGWARDWFLKAGYGAMQEVMNGRQKWTPQQAVEMLVSQFRLSKTKQTRVTDASREAIARSNQTLPAGPGKSGAPANIRKAGQKLSRIEDFNKDLQRRFGGGMGG